MTWEKKLKQIIEGAIMASESPLSLDNLMSLFEMDPPTRDAVRGALEEIEADCDGRGFELKKLASGYRFQVRGEYGEWVSRLWEERPQRYTRALLETLALIAYKQPITRGDIEEVRGVAVSTNIIRSLLEREWIRIVGHRDVPGRPAMYATTKSFLDYFNLSNLDELPTLSEIRDLDEMTSRLDLDEPLIEMKTIVLSDEDIEAEIFEDTDLDEVATTVDTIRENIRRVMAPPALDDDDDDDDSDDNDADDQPVSEDEAGVATDAPVIGDHTSDDDGDDGDILSNTGSPDAMQSGQQSSVERSKVAPTSAGDTNADILKAAFAEDADDDDTPH
ncbi:SMC-Scp complex subunit ScpB [Pseudomonadales bacterium]|jgi:segregation and condensation protein B|nr:SMC-Scp complex subunit ScpB [Pseudomonadales bacterium]